MALSDDLFGDYGMPVLWNFHADPTQITYVNGSTSVPLTAVLGPQSWVTMFDEDGLEAKHLRMEIFVNREANATQWGSIQDPQLKGHFEIGDDLWAIDDTEGEGVKEVTQNAMRISLVKIKPKRVTYRNHHRRLG